MFYLYVFPNEVLLQDGVPAATWKGLGPAEMTWAVKADSWLEMVPCCAGEELCRLSSSSHYHIHFLIYSGIALVDTGRVGNAVLG